MTREELRRGRLKAGLTQVEAARRLRLSQPYLSLLESGMRRVTPKLARAVAKLYALPPTSLPVTETPRDHSVRADTLARELSALDYPGYRHLRKSRKVNPGVVLLEALSQDELDARVTEALPWLLVHYPNLDWEWLVSNAKLRNLQNRLGFLTGVARELAVRRRYWARAAEKLAAVEKELEKARLAHETTLARENMSEAERAWLRANRSRMARHWNVLTNLRPNRLPYAP